MSILTRNVTGPDVLALRQTITQEDPITKSSLLELYYPGNSSDPQTSNQRKPIEDAIEFLVECGQISSSEAGYSITKMAADFDDAKLAILHGLRTGDGENGAYYDVLEFLSEQSDLLFDRNGELLDEMDHRASHANWNEQKLRYWTRVMETLGVTKDIYGADSTTIFGPSRDLTLRLLADVAEGDTESIAKILTEIDKRYLPVLGSNMNVAPYFEQTLKSLNNSGDIQLRTVSDIGQSISISDTSYSALEVMTNE